MKKSFIILFLLILYQFSHCQKIDTTNPESVSIFSDSVFSPFPVLPGIIFSGPRMGLDSVTLTLPVYFLTTGEYYESSTTWGVKVLYDSTNSFYKKYFLDSSGKCYKKRSSLPFTGEIKNDALSGIDGNDTITYYYKKGIIVEKKSFYKSGQLAEVWTMTPFDVLELKETSGEYIYVYYEWLMTCVSFPSRRWYENGQLASVWTESRMAQWYPDGKPASEYKWDDKFTIFRKWDEKGKLVEYSKKHREEE